MNLGDDFSLNGTNILWIILAVVIIVILYNNYSNKQNLEEFNSYMANTQAQLHLTDAQENINNNLQKIMYNDSAIKYKINELEKDHNDLKAFTVPDLPKCSYKTINGKLDKAEYPIKNTLIPNTSNMVPDARLPACPNMSVNSPYQSCVNPESNMCAQGVELKPYGYTFGDNQQEDNEFLNWVNNSKLPTPPHPQPIQHPHQQPIQPPHQQPIQPPQQLNHQLKC